MADITTEFKLDSKDGVKTVKIRTPFDDRSKARDQLQQQLEKTAKSSSAMMSMRDNKTGDFCFVNTMKLMSVEIKNEE